MKRKSIKKNYLFNLAYQILILITPLITTPYLSRVLGADGVGSVSFAESIVSYFSLFAYMGISTYGQREISYVQDSKEKRSIIFWNTKILSFVTATIVLCVYACFVFFQDNSLIYIILSMNLVAVFFDITWFFQGLEEFGKIVFRNIIFRIVNIFYIFSMVNSEVDILVYSFRLAFFTLVSNISLWGYLPRYVQKMDKGSLSPFKDIGIVISLFVPTIAVQVYTVLDKTMIGVITGNSFENGYYEYAIRMARMVLTVVTALGTVMIPRVGYYFEKKEIDTVKILMYRGYRFVWFLGIPLCFGMITIASNFVPWFFGEGYSRVVILLQILSMLILAIGINNVTGMQYLIPTKRQNLYTLTVLVGAVVNFILNMALIQNYQALGAAVASVIAETVIAIIQLIMVKKEISICRVLKEGKTYFVSGGIMAGVIMLVSRNLESSLFNTFFLTAVGFTVYMVILFILKDQFLISNFELVCKKILKR